MHMHANVSGPTKAVCYRKVFTIRGVCYKRFYCILYIKRVSTAYETAYIYSTSIIYGRHIRQAGACTDSHF